MQLTDANRNRRKNMMTRKSLIFTSVVVALVALALGVGPGWAQPPDGTNKVLGKGVLANAERKAAAERAKALGLKPGVAGLTAFTAGDTPLPGIEGPGGVPHYFGPYANWAYSPLPTRGILSVTVDPGAGGSGYINPTVTITDIYGTGTATATIDPATQIDLVTGAITGITLAPGSLGFHVPFVNITDPTGTGAAATAVLADWTTATGGLKKFVDNVALLGPGGVNNLGQYIPVAAKESVDSYANSDYYEIGLVEFYEKMHSDLPATRQRGYVQLDTANVLGAGFPLTYLNGSPICYPGTICTPGSDNQVKAVDNPHFLGPTIVGTSNRAVRIKFYNLLPVGPADDNTGRRPGDLFIPVDETVMGSGYGPAGPGTAGETYTQNRAAVHLHGNNTVWISDGTPHQWITPANETTSYPQGVSVRNVPDMNPASVDSPTDGAITIYYTNAMSARLMFYHDHAMGITRLNVYAGEAAGYVLTDAVDQDMICGTNSSGVNNLIPTGSSTKVGCNSQTNAQVLPDLGIPLVIQDRTFVDASTIFAQDPTWNWGTGPRFSTVDVSDPKRGLILNAVTGDLWVPHVYMSAQNPWDLGGMNAFGRWHYGPWFTPPTPECVNGLPLGCIEVGPVPNEYYQPDPSLANYAPWEPPMRPGVPNPSIPGEAFNDTPIVNGTAYPVLYVEPRAYRFRILNAANDRFLNLQFYKAYTKSSFVPGTGSAAPGTPTIACATVAEPAVLDCTEVKMIPVGGAPNQAADTPSGLPDPATAGPEWWQIGTEGGFLAVPTKVPIQPIGWNMDPTAFNVGVVNQHSLLLGTAERADVVVDFGEKNPDGSLKWAGKTLILYNDAPAAFPAGVPTYDYYTGVADQIDVGGAPGTLPGLGPNTRTIMQIRVGTAVATPTPDVTFANLQAVFAKTASKKGVFEVTQDPIIVPQAAYSSAYNAPATGSNAFPSDASQYLHIADTEMTFRPINKAGVLQPAVTIPLQMKAMHDEMGGVYDTLFGRMSGMLGLTNPQRGNAFLLPFSYASPPTDIIMGSADVDAAPVGTLADGTQIWRIFHNGVDTHTIHVHLFNAQLINRIGQDNWMVPAEPSEFGWKDTFRINPLEVTFLAMRPVLPTAAQVPFEVPDSIRLIDPTLPEGATLIPPPPAGWFDPAGIAIPEILNHYVNFGWEYVWHCHILAHEEMDMMHSLVAAVPPMAPTLPTAGEPGSPNGYTVNGGGRVTLYWVDKSIKETAFRIDRATNSSFTAGLTTFTYVNPSPTGPVTYVENPPNDVSYWYRVTAEGSPVGDTWVYPGSLGFPTMTANSAPLTIGPVPVGNPPAAAPTPPTNLTATLQAGPQATLTWRDNATNETGFVVWRCTGAGCTAFAQIAVAGPKNGTGNTSYVDTTVTAGNDNSYYSYRVMALNSAGSSDNTNIASVIVPPIPPAVADKSFTVTAAKANGNNYTATLRWTYPPPLTTAPNPTNFTIQRATNSTFTTGLSTSTVAGNLRTVNQTITKNTTYYYRIRSNNNISGSSAWANALPFPIRTGP
jgi:FtsP/CotA-like multicopper oxidase with cupredoxin domain